VTALVAQGVDQGLGMPLLKSVLEINRGQPAELLRLLGRHFPSLQGVRVAVLGIAFKPDTDDIRESPAFPVLRQLRAGGAELVAYDPIARPVEHEALKGVRLASDLADAVRDAQAIVLVTRWPEFGTLATVLAAHGSKAVVIDGRRMLDPGEFKVYEGIGR
jgi:UDPglucose 6-dehydrogenase/GDP-mannose 6-dehydrogenase